MFAIGCVIIAPTFLAAEFLKMKKFISICLISISLFNLAGCALNNQSMGTITGGLIGGLVGSRFGRGSGRGVAIAVGALAGSMIGTAIGRRMDTVDRMQMARSFDTGRPEHWTNEKTQHEYSVRPKPVYTSRAGTPCREFNMDVNIGGRKQQAYGTACHQADGSWKIVESN